MRSQRTSPSFPWWCRIEPNSPTCTPSSSVDRIALCCSCPTTTGGRKHWTITAHRPLKLVNDTRVDIALIDGTFWSADELSSRTQHEVPHPPVSETLERLGPRTEGDPEIVFIHMNHTNPIHRPDSDEHGQVTALGWSVGEQGMTFTL